MIHSLKLKNVGPAPTVELQFAERLNIFTGDNGLGKSFFLDIIWWSITRKWLKQINPKLLSGDVALPRESGESLISFTIDGKTKKQSPYECKYDRKNQTWQGTSGRPMNPGLIIYAMADGSIAIWDPMRNYWKTINKIDEQETPPAYVFSARELWYGLPSADGNGSYCRGLIDDWIKWQQLKSVEWEMMETVLQLLSPSEDEILQSGNPTQLDVTKVDEMPTLKMPYGSEVPIIHASAGIRRVLSLAYALVWAWQSHLKAARMLDEPATKQISILIDEMESHLHPQWQRRLLGSLMKVIDSINQDAKSQVFLTTHSPLVMVSCEDYFTEGKDAWYDINCINEEVRIDQPEFLQQGQSDAWLTSEAFDLKSTYSLKGEQLLEEAKELQKNPSTSIAQLKEMSKRIAKQLGEESDTYFMWKFYISQRLKREQ